MVHLIQLRFIKGMLLCPMPCYLLPDGEPNAFMALNIGEQLPQCLEACWLADEPIVQTNSHHFWLANATFFIHDMEGKLHVREPVLGI